MDTPDQTFSSLQSTERFSTAALGAERARVRLLDAAQTTDTVLEGARLEAQYAASDGGYILFLSDDCPYEERLQIYFLDDELVPRDHLELGRPYTAGLFRVLRDEPPPELVFELDGAHPYRLFVHRQPRRFLPTSLPGLTRRSGWAQRKYLEVRAADVQP